MTTANEAREAIYEAFVAVWTEEYSFDNEEFDPPKSDPWARLVVRHDPAIGETLGPVGHRRFTRSGTVYVQVFVPEDTGTTDMDALAETVRDAFEGVTLVGTTVRFEAVTVREIGESDTDKFYLTMVEAPFEYDETR